MLLQGDVDINWTDLPPTGSVEIGGLSFASWIQDTASGVMHWRRMGSTWYATRPRFPLNTRGPWIARVTGDVAECGWARDVGLAYGKIPLSVMGPLFEAILFSQPEEA